MCSLVSIVWTRMHYFIFTDNMFDWDNISVFDQFRDLILWPVWSQKICHWFAVSKRQELNFTISAKYIVCAFLLIRTALKIQSSIRSILVLCVCVLLLYGFSHQRMVQHIYYSHDNDRNRNIFCTIYFSFLCNALSIHMCAGMHVLDFVKYLLID